MLRNRSTILAVLPLIVVCGSASADVIRNSSEAPNTLKIFDPADSHSSVLSVSTHQLPAMPLWSDVAKTPLFSDEILSSRAVASERETSPPEGLDREHVSAASSSRILEEPVYYSSPERLVLNQERDQNLHVPEPASLALALVGGVVALVLRRSRRRPSKSEKSAFTLEPL